MTHPPRVLVLTLSFGSGHVRAAHAIAGALRRQAPEAEVCVLDALANCALLFRVVYVWPYWLMVRHAPNVWRALFSVRLRGTSRHTAPAWVLRAGCAHVFQAIARVNPTVIVATEVAASELAVIARRRRLTDAPMVNVITDHQAEPAWVAPEVNLFAVADRRVGQQLCSWGAAPERIATCGIPIDDAFTRPCDAHIARVRHHVTDDRPIVLLMGGGMGPTHMDRVAARLCTSGLPMHVFAIAGRDRRAQRRLSRVRPLAPVSLHVQGWSDDVPALMQAAALLVTKPGGLTLAEAAVCGLPAIMVDAIPGAEQRNARHVADGGAGILTRDADEAVSAVRALLGDERRRAVMAARARSLAQARAAGAIARLALDASRDPRPPVLILTIRNGAGHTRVADAIADAIRTDPSRAPVMVVDVADDMARVARLTHVTAYLWLVRHAPTLWDRIDRFQKRQPHTSPEWYYRSACRRLFARVRQVRPRALVATEVGCCEIAALIKRDLALDVPLVAVNGEYDADRAWVQPEVDLHCVATPRVMEELCAHGEARGRIRVWGVPVAPAFGTRVPRAEARAAICNRLGLEAHLPLILIGGGSEGLGPIDAVTRRLLRLDGIHTQLVVLAGRNDRLRAQCARLAHGDACERLRVLGWTNDMPTLMRAADLMVSKPGHAFDEAIASALPLVSLEPTPGSERVQYRLLDEWGVGRAVRSIEEMAAAVRWLLTDRHALEAMRAAASARGTPHDAARRIAQWIEARTAGRVCVEASS